MDFISFIANMFVKKDVKKERVLSKVSALRKYMSISQYIESLTVLDNNIFVKSKAGVGSMTASCYTEVDNDVFDFLANQDLIIVRSRLPNYVFAIPNTKVVSKVISSIKKDFFNGWSIKPESSSSLTDRFRINIGPYYFDIVLDEYHVLHVESLSTPITDAFNIQSYACYFLREERGKFYKLFKIAINKQIQNQLTAQMLKGKYNNTRYFLDETIPFTGRGGL